MQRREFISFLSGTIASWPLAARAQKPERVRLIGMLAAINDPEMKAFEQELEKRGWSEGRNIHIEIAIRRQALKCRRLRKSWSRCNPR